VGSWIVDPLIRDRAQILEGYKDEKAADAGESAKPASKPGSTQGIPGWTPHAIQ
jgi:hypothetical protein